MYNPMATYRIQFHKDFTFEEVERIIPYLQKLGVATVYASPVFEAVPGSTHGYDGVNPHAINPEIGTEAQLKAISKNLKEKGIGWLQDIVPNHMAFHPNNTWLMDVLEKGPQSIFASFFDTAWTSSLYQGRLMVPFLGAPLEEAIQKGELKVAYSGQRLVFEYFDSVFPLQPRSYATILGAGDKKAPEAIEQLVSHIPKMEEETAYALRWDELRLQLASLMKNDTVKAYVENCFEQVNQNPTKLQQLSDEQSYQLCYWQTTDKHINYRRFFTVNGLICVNIQDAAVFEVYHQLIKSLVEEGVFQGLRIDHIDGLYNPTKYLEDLRQLAGSDTYIVVEKILESGEALPQQWPVQGSTGYEFLAMVNNLFTQRDSEPAFTQLYQQVTGETASIPQQVYDKKSHILYHHMGGELENLYRFFMELGLVTKEDYAAMRTEDIQTAIAEFLIQCPVYRYYGDSMPLPEAEEAEVQHLFDRMRTGRSDLSPAINLLEEVLLKRTKKGDTAYNDKVAQFYQRCMQFSGPLMAKGVEDTLMYTYNRFIGHNEVGDSPEAFGITPDDFHQLMKDRQEQWPLAMNTTATHDTKRGEDVRARLNVVTDMADEWQQKVTEWQQLNADIKADGAPDANDEYFIYQTIIGAYPMPGEPDDNLANRLQDYIQKALREAKRHSNWTTPNEAYEQAAKNFAVALLDKDRPFWKSFLPFQQKVAKYGIINSLAQVLLKFTCPGIPDVYQGTELWDLSLVDPDNRRPVDYEKRQELLADLEGWDIGKQQNLWQELWQNKTDARIKLWLTHTLYNERKRQPDVFTKGAYIPLAIEGTYKDHVIAFARQLGLTWYVVAVPLHLAALCQEQDADPLTIDWKDTRILLPEKAPVNWQNKLLMTEGAGTKEIAVQQLFTTVPFALLQLQTTNERSAGLLLHITSLPSPFGIGDMGPEARAFADFMARSHQKLWQLLPINPVEEGQGYSPYSSVSSKAGNTLLISPELLVKDGLLSREDVQAAHLPHHGITDYEAARKVKSDLFQKAWEAYKKGKGAESLQQHFLQFADDEASWLNDFALYEVLKAKHGGKPWYQWPKEYKKRQPKAIEKLAASETEALEKIKWLQFIFSKQWKQLKHYCNNRGIALFGDIPFYVSYDSVDVWANKELFALDAEGNRTGMAGVPPDAFSDDGQLWGMPVFNWDVLKEHNYDWWIQRLRKNIELYDLIRLDHFRAFSEYWEVPAGEQTARNGEWKPGPGSDFFNVVKKELGELPFVAEDLGEIDDKVYQLRDDFALPGMKVLQFAFDESMPVNPYIPHNYTQNFVVYTGTHDNNTILGWWRQEGKDNHQRVAQYVGRDIAEEEVYWIMSRLAYASVAKTAILPVQDILSLDEKARMNIPSSGQNNWGWRLLPGQLNRHAENRLKEWTYLFNRE